MDDETKQAISDALDDIADAQADLETVQNRLSVANTSLKALITDTPPPSTTTITAQLGPVTSTQITVTWEPVQGASAYVIDRDGVDRNNYGSWGTTRLADEPRTLTFENLKAQTDYRISVTAYGGPTALAETNIVGRTAAETVTKGLKPLGLSKAKNTNVILFRSGVDDLNGLLKWQKDNGIVVDGLMRFVPRANADEFLAESFWNQMGQIAATGRITVIALPWAPESAGATMNSQVAAGRFDTFHAKIAALMIKYNLNKSNVVLRVAWEYNSVGGGGWYHWSTANGGEATFKAAWSRFRANLKAGGVTQPLWDQCANKGPQSNNSSNGASVYVDADIVGVDHYAMWPAQKDGASFDNAVHQVPGMASQAALAFSKGIQWSMDECGPANPAGDNLGGDSAAYAGAMVGVLRTATNLAMFTIYDDGGAPATFDHTLAHNPNWAKALKGWLG